VVISFSLISDDPEHHSAMCCDYSSERSGDRNAVRYLKEPTCVGEWRFMDISLSTTKFPSGYPYLHKAERDPMTSLRERNRMLEVLIVEDNPGDFELLRTALAEWQSEVRLNRVEDGEQALMYVHRTGAYASAPRPDLILLDLNLPRKGGIEVLANLKSDPALQEIPVVVLTSSDSNADVASAYRLHANSYLTKTIDLNEFFAKIRALEQFWLSSVRLPSDHPAT
jgi:CheY-like chemotaxis protein